jgi:hypothetical protein
VEITKRRGKMHLLYQIIVTIHVFAAIIGIGPTFVFPVITNFAKNNDQLKWSYQITNVASKFPKVGGITLIVTGLIMGWIVPSWFEQFWFDASIGLFIIIEIIVIGIIPKKMKGLVGYVFSQQSGEISEEYKQMVKKVVPFHSAVHILTILIIILMVVKPTL